MVLTDYMRCVMRMVAGTRCNDVLKAVDILLTSYRLRKCHTVSVPTRSVITNNIKTAHLNIILHQLRCVN